MEEIEASSSTSPSSSSSFLYHAGGGARGHRWKYPIYMQIPYLSLASSWLATPARDGSSFEARKKGGGGGFPGLMTRLRFND